MAALAWNADLSDCIDSAPQSALRADRADAWWQNGDVLPSTRKLKYQMMFSLVRIGLSVLQ